MHLEDLYRLLRSEHVQAQGIVDTLQDPLLVIDQNGCVVTGNRSFFAKFGLARDETIGRSLFQVAEGAWDVPELRRLISEVIPKATAVIGYEVCGHFKILGQRMMLVSARRLVHPDENSKSVLVAFQDITDQRQAEVDKDILLSEVHHRMKNLLAIVRAIATQTAVASRTAEEYRDVFLGRLDAVVLAEDLSSSERDLDRLVSRSLAPMSPSRYCIAPSPAVRLDKSQVMPFALILHELMTNAWKYGAFSKDGGIVHIAWKVSAKDGNPILDFTWREENGPPVTAPPRHGFGYDLIKFSTEQSLHGTAELVYDPSGFRFRSSTPLDMAQQVLSALASGP